MTRAGAGRVILLRSPQGHDHPYALSRCAESKRPERLAPLRSGWWPMLLTSPPDTKASPRKPEATCRDDALAMRPFRESHGTPQTSSSKPRDGARPARRPALLHPDSAGMAIRPGDDEPALGQGRHRWVVLPHAVAVLTRHAPVVSVPRKARNDGIVHQPWGRVNREDRISTPSVSPSTSRPRGTRPCFRREPAVTGHLRGTLIRRGGDADPGSRNARRSPLP